MKQKTKKMLFSLFAFSLSLDLSSFSFNGELKSGVCMQSNPCIFFIPGNAIGYSYMIIYDLNDDYDVKYSFENNQDTMNAPTWKPVARSDYDKIWVSKNPISIMVTPKRWLLLGNAVNARAGYTNDNWCPDGTILFTAVSHNLNYYMEVLELDRPASVCVNYVHKTSTSTITNNLSPDGTVEWYGLTPPFYKQISQGRAQDLSCDVGSPIQLKISTGSSMNNLEFNFRNGRGQTGYECFMGVPLDKYVPRAKRSPFPSPAITPSTTPSTTTYRLE